jgi:hypothetical protein
MRLFDSITLLMSFVLKEVVMRAGLMVVLLAALGWALPTTVVKNTDRQPITRLPLTLSLCFCEGEVAQALGVRVAGEAVACQWDVKRSWPDGSIKHALVSLIVPAINTGDSVAIILDPAAAAPVPNTAIALSDILASDFDARVTFTNLRSAHSASRTLSLSARELLGAAGEPVYWVKGPVATELIVRGHPRPSGGQPDSSVVVQFELRFFEGLGQAQVSVVGENILEQSIQNLWYDVAISLGHAAAQSVYTRSAVEHYYASRWRRVFTWGAPLPSYEVHHDIPYLITTGLLERYNLAHRVSSEQRRADSTGWINDGRDILHFGLITPYMPMPGGRRDIGPNPQWVVRWLLTQDQLYRDIALTSANCAGSFSTHWRESNATRLINIKKRPRASLNWWCYAEPDADIAKSSDSIASPATPDGAHMPNMVYVPYLLTGDHYYLEESYYWANWHILNCHWNNRLFDKGLYGEEVRGEAWALWRSIAETAAIAPDSDGEKGYFDAIVRFNIHYRDSLLLREGQGSPLGIYRSRDLERTMFPGDFRCMQSSVTHCTSPWMDDFVTMMLDHTVDLGYTEAIPLRDWKMRFPAGRFGRPAEFNPFDGIAYRMATLFDSAGTSRQITSFAELHQKTYTQENCGGRTQLAEDQYNFWARAALSAYPRMESSEPAAQAAYAFLRDNMPPLLDMDQLVDFVPGPPRTTYALGVGSRHIASRAAPLFALHYTPRSPTLKITLTPPSASPCWVRIFDATGRCCAQFTPGGDDRTVYWQVGQVSSGFYIVQVQQRGLQQTQSVLLMK